MTQEELASYLNITYQTVSKWETNASHSYRYHITPHAYIIIISQQNDFLKVSMNWFFIKSSYAYIIYVAFISCSA